MQKIAFIVPCYNEGDRLDSLAFIDFANSNKSIDFWFVNDGSIDNTEIVLQQLINKIPSQFFLHSIKTNNGKASAVRDAFLKISSL